MPRGLENRCFNVAEFAAGRLAFTSSSRPPHHLRRAVYESAPDWITEDVSDTPNVTKIDEGKPADVNAISQTPSEASGASAVESASRSVIDQIIADIALDDPEVVKARIAAGQMNFEDFVATTTVMSQADSNALSVPSGYEKLIQAMTLEERRNPLLFRDEPGVDERISRITKAAGADAGVAATFLKDFGSLQRFFAKMQSGGQEGALKESMQMAAEYLANKPRRLHRQKENQNKLLKKAGQKLREKKAVYSAFHRFALEMCWSFVGYFRSVVCSTSQRGTVIVLLLVLSRFSTCIMFFHFFRCLCDSVWARLFPKRATVCRDPNAWQMHLELHRKCCVARQSEREASAEP